MFNKVWLPILMLTGCSVLAQSRTYTGTVRIKGDPYPLPGVQVVLKGTAVGTITDFDGHFKIEVPDSLSALQFSYVGIQPLEYKLKDENNLEIYLKEDCTFDWFDERKIGFYLNSGLVNTPMGGMFHLSFTPTYQWPTFKTGIGYQTNGKENSLLYSYLNLHHLFAGCNFNAELNTAFKTLEYDHSLRFTGHEVETKLNFSGISAIVGMGQIDFTNQATNKNVHGLGPTLGMGSWIGRPFLMSFSAKATLYKDLTEYQAQLKKEYRRYYSYLKFDKVDTFTELSLGLGMEFWY